MGMSFGAVLHSWPEETKFGQDSAAAHCLPVHHDIKGLFGKQKYRLQIASPWDFCKEVQGEELTTLITCHSSFAFRSQHRVYQEAPASSFSAMHFCGPLQNMAFRA